MRRVIPLLLFPGLLLAACAQAQPGPPGSSDLGGAGTNDGPDEVVLRIEYVDGFVTVQTLVARLPIVTVYGDGRVITEGPQIMIYPGPALPNVLVRHIGVADVNRLVAMAVDAGVGSGADYGNTAGGDLPSTKFTVATEDGVLTTEVYAPEFVDGLTEEQANARRRLVDLQAALTDLPATLGADAVSAEQPYEPVALAALASPFAEPEDGPAQPEMAWPGPALPGEALANVAGPHCVTVTGADLATVLEAAREANQLTPWASDGERWFVMFRPLLPEESACADLAG